MTAQQQQQQQQQQHEICFNSEKLLDNQEYQYLYNRKSFIIEPGQHLELIQLFHSRFPEEFLVGPLYAPIPEYGAQKLEHKEIYQNYIQFVIDHCYLSQTDVMMFLYRIDVSNDTGKGLADQLESKLIFPNSFISKLKCFNNVDMFKRLVLKFGNKSNINSLIKMVIMDTKNFEESSTSLLFDLLDPNDQELIHMLSLGTKLGLTPFSKFLNFITKRYFHRLVATNNELLKQPYVKIHLIRNNPEFQNGSKDDQIRILRSLGTLPLDSRNLHFLEFLYKETGIVIPLESLKFIEHPPMWLVKLYPEAEVIAKLQCDFTPDSIVLESVEIDFLNLLMKYGFNLQVRPTFYTLGAKLKRLDLIKFLCQFFSDIPCPLDVLATKDPLIIGYLFQHHPTFHKNTLPTLLSQLTTPTHQVNYSTIEFLVGHDICKIDDFQIPQDSIEDLLRSAIKYGNFTIFKFIYNSMNESDRLKFNWYSSLANYNLETLVFILGKHPFDPLEADILVDFVYKKSTVKSLPKYLHLIVEACPWFTFSKGFDILSTTSNQSIKVLRYIETELKVSPEILYSQFYKNFPLLTPLQRIGKPGILLLYLLKRFKDSNQYKNSDNKYQIDFQLLKSFDSQTTVESFVFLLKQFIDNPELPPDLVVELNEYIKTSSTIFSKTIMQMDQLKYQLLTRLPAYRDKLIQSLPSQPNSFAIQIQIELLFLLIP
eukprot:gene7387-9074_t